MPIIDRVNETANPSNSQSNGMDYRYYADQGVPFYGQPPLMTAAEYPSRTTSIGFAGYGLFDVSDPEQKHFGRTLKEVLERQRLGEFEVISMNEYNNGVDKDPREPPALFVFAMWIERADTTPDTARRYASQQQS